MARINNHLVIMAGGVGSRFWPMSTAECPKQFIDVLGTGKTLLQLTVERFGSLIAPENVWVVTNEKYADIVAAQLPKKKDPKANIVVTPSDHIVMNIQEFQRVIGDCMKFTADTDAIVTLGMKPSRPETGYGYIQANLGASSLRNKGIFRVDSFREKPDLQTAQEYISHNNYYWNAGIFVWNVNTIVNAFRMYQPKLAKIFESMLPVYDTPEEQQAVNEKFPTCENISVDYAIMEKADEIFVCPADFGWSDLGTWGSLQTQSKRDLYGNALIGPDIQVFETHNCMIHTTQEKKVVVQGLDGYIVAENNDTLLICKLSEEQRIKQFSGEN